MKNRISLIICLLVFCFILTSCGLNSVNIPPMPTATPVPIITSEPTSTPEPVADTTGYDNPIIISIKDVVIKDLDPEYQSYEILNFRCQIPTVYIDGKDEASNNINNVLAENCKKIYSDDEGVDVILDKRNELLMLAEDNFSEETPIEFKYSRIVQIIRADDNLVIIQFTESSKTFGDEECSEEYLYFDTKTGNLIDNVSAQNEEYKEPSKMEIGKLTVLESAPADSTVLDLIVDDENGTDYFISCEGVIYDLNIGGKWYCNMLSDNCIQLRTTIPEGMPTLSVSYITGGEVYIYVFGKDLDSGNISLIDPNSIEAVG